MRFVLAVRPSLAFCRPTAADAQGRYGGSNHGHSHGHAIQQFRATPTAKSRAPPSPTLRSGPKIHSSCISTGAHAMNSRNRVALALSTDIFDNSNNPRK